MFELHIQAWPSERVTKSALLRAAEIFSI